MRLERLRHYVGPVTNTDVWETFQLRPSDIIVDTPPKCGTTWMLNIAMMLVLGRAQPDAGGSQHAPWLDCAFRDREEISSFLDGLERRRVIKSHTPLDGIPFGPDPTYIVVYRHPVDLHFSLKSHVANFKEDWLDFMFPNEDGAAFQRFLTAPATSKGTDDLTIASLVHHYRMARNREGTGNVHFFHYADLTRDLPGEITRLARVLGIPLSDALRDEIAEGTSFNTMRRAIEKSERRFAETTPFHDLAKFYDSGTSNKWQGRLSDDQMEAYSARIGELLSPEDRLWLEWGDQRKAA